MKENVTVKAYCKINISLDIKSLREDGKHEVDMIMQSLPLHDVIEMKKFKIKSQKLLVIMIYLLKTTISVLSY